MKKILFIGLICIMSAYSVIAQSKKTWKNTQIANTITGYQSFIDKYPDSEYLEIAKQNLEQLKEQETKLKEQEALSKKIKEQKLADLKAAGEKIVPGTSFEKVISLLSMENVVNRSNAGGLAIGVGIFPQNPNEKSVFTGTASLDGYDIVFEKGKVVSKQLVAKRLGSKAFGFSSTYSIF